MEFGGRSKKLYRSLVIQRTHLHEKKLYRSLVIQRTHLQEKNCIAACSSKGRISRKGLPCMFAFRRSLGGDMQPGSHQPGRACRLTHVSASLPQPLAAAHPACPIRPPPPTLQVPSNPQPAHRSSWECGSRQSPLLWSWERPRQWSKQQQWRWRWRWRRLQLHHQQLHQGRFPCCRRCEGQRPPCQQHHALIAGTIGVGHVAWGFGSWQQTAGPTGAWE